MTKHIQIKARTGWSALNFREIVEFWDLLIVLFVRDIKLRYKQTALGVTWVVLQPLLGALIFALLFGKIAKFPSEGHPYLLFALTGMLPWFLFSQSVLRGSICLVNNSAMISKVYFPRLLLPISSCMAILVDFAVCLATVFCIMVWYHTLLTWHILLLPFLIAAVFALSLGCTILSSAINVFYRDTSTVIQFMIQLMMYASPVAYSSSVVPAHFQLLYTANPMVGIIDAFRWCILGSTSFPWASFSWAFCATIGIFIISIFTFRRVERFFADII